MGIFRRIGGAMPYTDWQNLNLDWILDEIEKVKNEWIETKKEINDFEFNTNESIKELKDYIIKSFEDLELQEYVNKWLDEHPEATTTVLDNSITEIKLNSSLKEKLLSLSNVRTYGAKENNPDIGWQEIIEQIALVSDTLYFDDGQWIINEPLVIPENIRNIVGSGCIIKTEAQIDSLITLGYTERYPFPTIQGLNFDCDYKVQNVIVANTSNTLHIYNCNFNNFTEYGVYTRYLGNIISNCVFNYDYIEGAEYEPVGVYVASDTIIADSKFFKMTKAIVVMDEYVNIHGCYIWGGNDSRRTYGIVGDPLFTTYAINVADTTNNEFDCLDVCFENYGGRIMNNTFVYNNSDSKYEGDRYFFIHTRQLINLTFSFNTIHYYPVSAPTWNYYQFQASGTNARLISYKSEGNYFNTKSSTAQRFFFMYMGVNPSGIGSAAGFIHVISAGGNINIVNQAIYELNVDGTTLIRVRNNNTSITQINRQYNDDSGVWVHTDVSDNNRKKDFYICGYPAGVSKITHIQGSPYNFSLAENNTAPDVEEYTYIDSTKVA